MSGICGIAFHELNRQVHFNDLMPMVQALAFSMDSKGLISTCDSTGFGAYPFSDYSVGMTELMLHDKPLVLAFYGKIYNVNSLSSDGEHDSNILNRVLSLYRKEGLSFLQKLRGEYVLAIWDGMTRSLHLATDRFRIHPLFFYQDQEKIVFASHMKSILACQFSIKRTMNPKAILQAVSSSFIRTPMTIFQEVKKVPPGNILTWQNGKSHVRSYWDLSFLDYSRVGKAKLRHELLEQFDDSIMNCLGADPVPNCIGSFLSGGIDSSTVTGVLTEQLGSPIKSFSIGFDEPGFNEIHYARLAAKAFGTKHHEYVVSPKDTFNAIPKLLEYFDEPFGNASSIPTYYCAKLAQEHGVKILFAGDGGDELFAGNERYATQRIFDYYYLIPKPLRDSFVKPLAFALADKMPGGWFLKGKKYIQRACIPYPERLCSWGFFKVVPPEELMSADFLSSLDSDISQNMIYHYYYQAPAQNDLDRQLYIDLKLAISDNDLFKVTKMTRAAGVEVRFPFLDSKFAEFAATIPAQTKMRGLKLRSFFKESYSHLLPREIRTKRKHGFGLPIPLWLRTDKQLNEMMNDLVLSKRTIERGYFNKNTLASLVDAHKTDETSFYGTALWNLMVFEMWLRQSYDEKVHS